MDRCTLKQTGIGRDAAVVSTPWHRIVRLLVAAGSMAVLGPGTAAAAPGETLRPAAATSGHVATESSQVLPKWTPAAALHTTYLRKVGARDTSTLAVDSRAQAHLLMAFGIAGWAQIDAALPMTLSQRGTAYEQGRFVPLRQAALGDVRLGAKGTLLRTPRKGFGLGVMFDTTLPTGSDEALTSAGGPTYTPSLLGELRIRRGITFAINAGYQIREEENIDGHLSGDMATYRAAVRVPVAPREQFAVFAELDGGASMVRGGPSPLVGRGGFRWSTKGGLVMNLWGGGAILSSLGVPTMQLGLSAGFSPVRKTRTERAFEGNDRMGAVALARGYDRALAVAGRPPTPPPHPDDPDGDGIFARADLCPEVAEDLDGMLDSDGCPELDDDRDGLRDSVDLCPRAPEVINGYRDGDGCPDRRLAKGGQTFETFDERRILPTLRFAKGSATVDANMQASLDELAELLRLNPWIERLQLAVFVERTDDEAADRALADARSSAIDAALQARGVAKWRVQTLAAKAVPAGTPTRVRLSLSGRAGAMDPVAPRAETLDRLIADAVENLQLPAAGPIIMEAQGPPAESEAEPEAEPESSSDLAPALAPAKSETPLYTPEPGEPPQPNAPKLQR